MALLVGTYTNPAEQILILESQAQRAYVQQQTAEKAVLSFAGQIKNNRTPQNINKLEKLVAKALKATLHATDLRQKIAETERAYYNPNGLGASLENRQVAELDLDEPLGYFPS